MTPERAVDALGVLAEPQRRRLYEHLLAADDALSQAELGRALELSRTLVNFHLTKLLDAGLVTTLAPRGSQGRRGRPAQRYRPTGQEVMASVPPRRYEVIAEILLQAHSDNGPRAARMVTSVARRRGAELAAASPGSTESPSPHPAASPTARLTHVQRVLTAAGYAARREAGQVLLSNCPFERLRQTNVELVCTINQSLVQGYLDALGLDTCLEARLEPAATRCCVVIRSI